MARLRQASTVDKYGDSYEPLRGQSLGCCNYFLSLVSLLTHVAVMWLLMDTWCGGSKLAIAYTFQIACLHAYVCAMADRRFTQWVL